jgi:hypothetical protein
VRWRLARDEEYAGLSIHSARVEPSIQIISEDECRITGNPETAS